MKKLLDINRGMYESIEKEHPRRVFVHLWIRSFFIKVCMGSLLLSISQYETWFLTHIPYLAFIEEVWFRHLPGVFVMVLFHKLYHVNKDKFYLYTTLIMLVSSVIFGYLHGGVINIFVQGIGGIFLFLIYLKFQLKALKDTRVKSRLNMSFSLSILPLLMSTLFHSLYNYAITLLSFV